MLDGLYINVSVKFDCLREIPDNRSAEDALNNSRKNADTRPYKTDGLDQKTACVNRREKPAPP